ncbi:type II secretion system protein GspE [Yersinia kristensenii]|uniref:type II secretion system protein GspE n=1 Tax=Yersinia kristensenii TaxID=28152 RepID=UPI0016437FF1|nr:type II secretion system protein GspE [Yersinia kristensenii]MBW5811343.1 type II secretion system protein GspE [Yersinia kristensenii]MBW5815084.1 type II secretion system protein GspE [Yersinia kristensenii]MBW5828605.1 type II secretion system protein GspE [Yersinia kristensenii]MBW5840992.1 type II secretion system protein GspE [Yersinia kristensenii]MDA5489064.1 type II secretion system protein GspE [Yersinia kristensenii]
MTEFMKYPSETINSELHTLCRRYRSIALKLDGKSLTIASSGPVNEALLTALRFACGRKIKVENWPEAKIEQSLNLDPSVKGHLSKRIKSTEAHHNISQQNRERQKSISSNPEPQGSDDTLLDNESDIPVIQFITQTLRLAIQKRASDIHFEPYQYHYRIRLRIDGVLHESPPPAVELSSRISGCLKVMSKLNIAEKRLAQDGQLALMLDGIRYSMRIATLPVQYGEKVVLRILNMQQKPTLEKLGIPPLAHQQFTQALSAPQGLILVTGPTGSGKTVTLYCSLDQLNQPQINICSVEDPIEIQVNGINQTQTNSKIGLDFSSVLRAMLRQDPDVIMLGEIRDNETAEIAVKAALTGHLVLSTLHTNSTAETLIRLTQMGVARHLIASSLTLVIAQRLVRKLCLHCRQASPTPFKAPKNVWVSPLQHYIAVGCEHCCAGYYGRTGIYEMLNVTPPIQQALLNNASPSELTQIAQEQKQVTLLSAGLTLVESGMTTLSEINRVVGLLTEAEATP